MGQVRRRIRGRLWAAMIGARNGADLRHLIGV
jgi:hypothetical protein